MLVSKSVVKDEDVVWETDAPVKFIFPHQDDRVWFLARCGSHWMDWEFHNEAGQEMDGSPIFGDDYREFDPAPHKGSILLCGFVKWDGCTQFDAPNGFHYDHCVDVPDLRVMIAYVWQMAKQHMPAWSNP